LAGQSSTPINKYPITALGNPNAAAESQLSQQHSTQSPVNEQSSPDNERLL
jgi:hypothetical protein